MFLSLTDEVNDRDDTLLGGDITLEAVISLAASFPDLSCRAY